MSSRQRRVVITGVGAISPLGNTKEALWEALASGRSGVGPLSAISPEATGVHAAAAARQFSGEIDDFGPLEKEQKKAIRKGLKVMCRECLMGTAAAQLALQDAGQGLGKSDPERTGISFGVDYMLSVPEEFTEGIQPCVDERGAFQFSRWGTIGLAKMPPLWLLKYLPNMPASHLAIYNDLRGPNNSLTLREAAANLALGEAFQIILRGSAEAMLVGATGTRLHCMKIVHSLQQEELACGNGDPTRISRPFDRNRTGMVLGEGAAAVLLEELARAQARGATIYGEVLSAASSSVVAPKLLARRQQAIGNVLQAVLRPAGARARRGRPSPRPRPEHAKLRRGRGPRDPRRLRRPRAAHPRRGRQELLRQPWGRRRHGRADRQPAGPPARPSLCHAQLRNARCRLSRGRRARRRRGGGRELHQRQRHAAGPGQRGADPPLGQLIDHPLVGLACFLPPRPSAASGGKQKWGMAFCAPHIPTGRSRWAWGCGFILYPSSLILFCSPSPLCRPPSAFPLPPLDTGESDRYAY